MSRIIAFCVLYFVANVTLAQDIFMSNGVVSGCSGTFYDSGGDSTNYANNENYVYTICSDQPGKCIQLSFQSFAIEKDFDFVFIYNGPSTSSPLLGTFTGTNSPGIITATSGCLTIRFSSDYTVNRGGWKAYINCINCPVNGCPTCNGGAPPPNDACSGAQNLGVLPAPAACPNGIGAVSLTNTSNLCATSEIPYQSLQGCKPIGNMSNPATDVWYKFSLTAPVLDITINGLITPQVGLYSGTGCGNLVPRGCAIGGGGYLYTTFGGLAAGTYYLQISGGNMNDQCNFSLSLQNNFDCSGCVMQSALTVSPPPTNGFYLSGQQVTFCLNVTDFNPTSANWLHGIAPKFGPGWDTSTLIALPPSSCSNNGFWSWYANPIISSANNQPFGPGFFYETSAGNSSNTQDNNPGNNFGDNLGQNCTLNFCWKINTLPQSLCNFGTNLNVFIETYTDGESGSWTSTACANDPVHDLYATLACCIPPVVAITQPVCFGTQGSAIGTAQGSGPWTYIWKNSSGVILQQNGPVNGIDIINNLNPGTYQLITEDVNGCQSTVSFAVIQPQPLAATLTVSATKCGLVNGSINVTASGGTAPYSYSINNGVSYQGSPQFNNLNSGNFTITIKDANNCTVSVPAVVNASTIPVINSFTWQDITCYNGADGEITVLASSGIGPYVYEIKKSGLTLSQSSNIIQNVPAGNYQLTVTDVNGCKSDTTVILTQPPQINLVTVITPSGCNLNDGTIELTITSSFSGTLLYSIDNGTNYQTSNLFTNLNPGVYNVLIEDGNGCMIKDTAIVNTINAPNIDSIKSQSLTCYRSQDGALNIYGSGGVGTLSYSINNGSTYSATNSFNSLTAKTYTIVIKDNNNCRVYQLAAVKEPMPIIIRGDIVSTSCGLNNGSANLHPDNGVLPLEYSTDGGLTWSTNYFYGQLPPGTITFTVRDANGCTSTRPYQIAASTAPSFDNVSVQSLKCFNTNTGSITLNSINGIPPITYSIDSGITYQPTNQFQNLISGNYYLSIKDNKGCRADSTIQLSQPAQLSFTSVITNTVCSYPNGSIDISGNGGTTPYTYSIDGGATFTANSYNANLTPGSYKIVLRDTNNCEEASTANIIDEPGPRITGHSFSPQICDNAANASVTINAISGTGTLFYSADSGLTYSTSNNINNLNGGNCTLIVRDANLCIDTLTLNIPILHSPQIDNNATTDPICFGNNDGVIQIVASGGNGIISYSIDNGANFFTNSTFSQLNAGTYFLMVEDSNHCQVKDTVILTQPPLLTAQIIVSNETCSNQNGMVSIIAGGGTPAYYFELSNNTTATDTFFTQLSAGNYTIITTDFNGCTTQSAFQINNLNNPTINQVASTNLSCYQSGDGIIQLTAAGNGPVQYSLDGIIFQNSNIFGQLSAGSYIITVRDTNGCTTDTTILLTEPDAITANIQTTSSNCTLSNGSITVTASGGSGNLTYSLNGGMFSSQTLFNNLSSGNQNLIIQDANNCQTAFVASINTINGAIINNISTVDIKCHGQQTGEITIAASGGTGPLSYSIDNGLSSVLNNHFTMLSAGNYNIILTDSVGCITSSTITLNEPDSIIIQQAVTAATCNQQNGSFQIVVNGGTGTLQLSLDSLNFSPNTIFNNLIAGIYQLHVTDANQCYATKLIVVPNLAAPILTNFSKGDVTCFGDSTGFISLTASGGTGILNYSIDNGITYQALPNFTNLPAGSYHIKISDQNLCTADTIIQLTSPDDITATFNITNANCQQTNGSISVNAQGGNGTLLFSLNGGPLSQQTYFGSLPAGTHQLQVMDAMMCSKNIFAQINTISGPTIDSVITQNLKCFGINSGTISILASGGTGVLGYSINNQPFISNANFNQLAAGTYHVTVTDSAGCLVSGLVQLTTPSTIQVNTTVSNPACGQNNGSLTLQLAGGTGTLLTSLNGSSYNNITNYSNLYAGSYILKIKDANNCEVQRVIPLSNILAPKLIGSVLKQVKCFNANDGEIKILASGGTGALTYSIDNGATTQMSNTFSSLTAGSYSASVIDQNNCRSDTVITLLQPDSLQLLLTITPETCSSGNGSITVSSIGGTSPYLFSSDSGQTFYNVAGFSQLVSNNYYLIVKDSKNCRTLNQVNIADLTGPQIISLTTANVSCFGLQDGTVQITTTGGNGTLSFSTNNFITQQTDTFFNSLLPGNYTVYVSDTNNCKANHSFTISQPTPIQNNITSAQPTCSGYNNGSLHVIANGGTPPYDILWSSGSTDFNLSGIASGQYLFTVTDANNCNKSDSIYLSSPTALAANHTTQNGTCSGSANGSAWVSVAGGTPPYQYNWSPIAGNTNYANALPAGLYMVDITDKNGCTLTEQIQIVTPAPIANKFSKNDVSCYGGSNGMLITNTTGGTAPYSYLWSYQQQTNDTIQNLPVGSYTVTITDANGCDNLFTEQISAPQQIKPNSTITNVSCNGLSDATVTLNVQGGVAPYSYQWNNGTTQSINANLSAGIYVVTVTDANGCNRVKAFTITEPLAILLSINSVDTICIGQQATLNAIAAGGTGTYNWLWNNQATSSTILVTPTVTTSYFVSVTDSNNCPSKTDSISVNVFPPLGIAATGTDTICSGQSTVLSSIANGGNGGPYSYLWSNGSDSSSVNVFPTVTTTYSVSITDNCTLTPATAVVPVVVNETPAIDISPMTEKGCMPLEVQFFNNSSYPQGTIFTWLFGDGQTTDSISPLHIYNTDGIYTVTVQAITPDNCVSSFIMSNSIEVYPLPVSSFSISPESISILHPEITISESSLLSAIWFYDFGDGKTSAFQNPTHIYQDTGRFTVIQIVESEFGCRDTSNKEVIVEGAFTVYIPNAFTPNNDGNNDYFFANGYGITELKMQIFNRWGNKVFETPSVTGRWNGIDTSGKICPQGVYVYTAKIKDQYGIYHTYNGQVTLIR
ncbi:MAG TPA: gliding motility-associated C-terminal domain-containing protein [Bacteroidia bacterium]|nr:gliding motility-associated C-terminal domain-containing protein [Bacteroidia bacterium]HMU20376.1 gliding motility-associated C-terminal domain-containing protein [Bacteroidia bacterium]